MTAPRSRPTMAPPPSGTSFPSVDSDGRSRCVRLSCDLSAATCRARQAKALYGSVAHGTLTPRRSPKRMGDPPDGATIYPSCRGCPQGQAIVAALGRMSAHEADAMARARRRSLIDRSHARKPDAASVHDARMLVARLARARAAAPTEAP